MEKETLYATRIAEHLARVNQYRRAAGQEQITLQMVSEGTGITYGSVLRYANLPQTAPNFAFVDKIRRYLNTYLPDAAQLPDGGYIYPMVPFETRRVPSMNTLARQAARQSV